MKIESNDYNLNKYILTLLVFTLLGSQCADYQRAIMESDYNVSTTLDVSKDHGLIVNFHVTLPVLIRNPKLDSIHYRLSTNNNGDEIRIGATTLRMHDSMDWDEVIEHHTTISIPIGSFEDASKIIIQPVLYRNGKHKELTKMEIDLTVRNER